MTLAPVRSPIGFLIFAMFLICAPTIRTLLSILADLITYIIIPTAIAFRICDASLLDYLLSIDPLNRLMSGMLHVDDIKAVKIRMTVASDKESDIGPFELPDTSTRSNSMSSPVIIPSGGLSPVDDTGSYDRLSDISPGSSPIEPHSAPWRDLKSHSDEFHSKNQETAIPAAEQINAPGPKRRPATYPPSLLPRPTKKTSIPTSATTTFGDGHPWSPGANSFSSPAIQEKLRQQSILYHQIHDLLAEHLGTKPGGSNENLKSTLAHVKHKPSLPSIPEPKFKIEGVDHSKIKALKEKYPDKKALHKHLDTYSAVMGRFVALCAPEVSILEMKPIEYDEEEEGEQEENKAVPPMRRRAATHSGVRNVKTESLIPTYTYARSVRLEKCPSPTRTVNIEKNIPVRNSDGDSPRVSKILSGLPELSIAEILAKAI
ncbi:hypothetical protein AA313_de0204936 [Arthrobotrys entomopaga]|nr:hypothetical protein AA313_de0204936 [Arthrobotrys entomopaga]